MTIMMLLKQLALEETNGEYANCASNNLHLSEQSIDRSRLHIFVTCVLVAFLSIEQSHQQSSCKSKCMQAFKLCRAQLATSKEERLQCAKMYVKTFPSCFFKGKVAGKNCVGSVTQSFYNCKTASPSYGDKFACKIARYAELNKCTQNLSSKRDDAVQDSLFTRSANLQKCNECFGDYHACLSGAESMLEHEEARTGYAIMIMAIFWCTEVTNLTVTALLPLLLFPALCVMSAKDIAPAYFKDTNILVLGGLMMAVAIERWNLHKRISLKVLLLIGTSPRRLMLGFMIVTAFVSMWITNTATTAMMTPIMEAVLKQLDEEYFPEKYAEKIKEPNIEEMQHEVEDVASSNIELVDVAKQGPERQQENQNEDPFVITSESAEVNNSLEEEQNETDDVKRQNYKTLCKAMTLSICYAANIGGTGTLTGTTPQQILAGQLTDVFKDGPGMSFLLWTLYALPEMLLFLFIAWIYLQTVFFGIRWKHICCCFRRKKRNSLKGNDVYTVMKKQYADLGPMSFAEKVVLCHFVALVLCWIFRDPKFIPGWGALFPMGKRSYVSDSTAGVIICFSMFVFPSVRPQIFGGSRNPKPHTTILEWKYAQSKFPWNVTILLGSGFAIAKACEHSGLSIWLGCQLSGLKSIPDFVIVLIICILLTFLTEFTSNTATATILLPVLASLAQSIQIHPYYLMVPAAVCASFAFMLPIAGPSNAIVFSTGRITITDMMKAGFAMNIIGILVVTLCINTYGKSYFNLSQYPSWALSATKGVQCAQVLASTASPANMTTHSTFVSNVTNF
eukprot:gene7051-7843_t